nr:ATP-binding protein [Rubricella aquisinus]
MAYLADRLPDLQVFKAEVALVEALSNVVEHAETTRPAEPIEIAVRTDDDVFAIDIFDPVGAQPFDLREHASDLGTVDIWAERGRGIGLILLCTDEVAYGPLDGRNRLSLKFKLETAE